MGKLPIINQNQEPRTGKPKMQKWLNVHGLWNEVLTVHITNCIPWSVIDLYNKSVQNENPASAMSSNWENIQVQTRHESQDILNSELERGDSNVCNTGEKIKKTQHNLKKNPSDLIIFNSNTSLKHVMKTSTVYSFP